MQDRYEKIGAPNDTSDVYTSSPIGTKGVPIASPYPPGQNGDQPPPAAQLLDWYALDNGQPA